MTSCTYNSIEIPTSTFFKHVQNMICKSPWQYMKISCTFKTRMHVLRQILIHLEMFCAGVFVSLTTPFLWCSPKGNLNKQHREHSMVIGPCTALAWKSVFYRPCISGMIPMNVEYGRIKLVIFIALEANVFIVQHIWHHSFWSFPWFYHMIQKAFCPSKLQIYLLNIFQNIWLQSL